MSHIPEGCGKPKIDRHWKHGGMVWACSCDTLWRVVCIATPDGFLWDWAEIR